jgi:hypothetical protein
VIRRLQTSLFGRSAEVEKPVTKREGVPRTLPKVSPPVDPDLAARWVTACDGLDIALVPVPRLRQGWKLEWRRGALSPAARLRVPKLFTDAPDDILRMLAAWALLAMQRKSPARRGERLALEKNLHAWIAARHKDDGHTRKLVRRRAVRRLEKLNPKGKHHDLEAILAAVNTEYFDGALEARITWSARWGGLSTQTTAHDEHGKPYSLLTISRGYDHPSATTEIVGGVVYHECLHIVVPPKDREGRRVVHGREFRRREKEYRFYEEWRRWHAEKLPGIIRRGRSAIG